MKKMNSHLDELRKEYTKESLGKGVRGKYAHKLRRGSNIIILEPELADAFPTSKEVNEALYSLLTITKRIKYSNRNQKKAG